MDYFFIKFQVSFEYCSFSYLHLLKILFLFKLIKLYFVNRFWKIKFNLLAKLKICCHSNCTVSQLAACINLIELFHWILLLLYFLNLQSYFYLLLHQNLIFKVLVSIIFIILNFCFHIPNFNCGLYYFIQFIFQNCFVIYYFV